MTPSDAQPTILVVDDEPGIRDSYRNYLEDHDFTVLEAENGDRALDILESRPVDLIVLDLRMPGRDGLEILENIRTRNPDIPVIIVSGTGDMHDVIRAMALGAWDYHVKPLADLDLLLHSIDRGLERLKMVREREAYREKLETAVVLRTKELAGARDRAEAANRAKDRFLANVSHELRTPLNGIMGLLQLMHETNADKTQRRYIEEALYSSRNLLTILNDILDLSSIDSGRASVNEENFDLTEILRTVDGNFRYQAQSRGVGLTYDIHPDLPQQVIGDRVRVRQILFNLVGNAVKYTEKGIVHISAAPLSPKGHDSHGRLVIRILFTVSDTGVGIPEEIQDHVFDAFVAENERSERIRGAGMGLNIVSSLVRLMNGSIAFESEPNRGSTFYLQIPFVPAVTESLNIHSKAKPLPRGAKVLLAEDDRVNQLFTKKLLELFGLHVLLAQSGREALDILEREDVDCVLMDIQMPDIDGLEATKIIRSWNSASPLSRKARAAKLPIVAITAHALRGDREAFLEAGLDRYLSKPLDKDALQRTLVELLGPSTEAGHKGEKYA
ncbi:MAG: response regulator [Deltaproteobacteria bacterium]|nr:response regulator [Deltaproteobacteria bacterium]